MQSPNSFSSRIFNSRKQANSPTSASPPSEADNDHNRASTAPSLGIETALNDSKSGPVLASRTLSEVKDIRSARLNISEASVSPPQSNALLAQGEVFTRSHGKEVDDNGIADTKDAGVDAIIQIEDMKQYGESKTGLSNLQNSTTSPSPSTDRTDQVEQPNAAPQDSLSASSTSTKLAISSEANPGDGLANGINPIPLLERTSTTRSKSLSCVSTRKQSEPISEKESQEVSQSQTQNKLQEDWEPKLNNEVQQEPMPSLKNTTQEDPKPNLEKGIQARTESALKNEFREDTKPIPDGTTELRSRSSSEEQPAAVVEYRSQTEEQKADVLPHTPMMERGSPVGPKTPMPESESAMCDKPIESQIISDSNRDDSRRTEIPAKSQRGSIQNCSDPVRLARTSNSNPEQNSRSSSRSSGTDKTARNKKTQSFASRLRKILLGKKVLAILIGRDLAQGVYARLQGNATDEQPAQRPGPEECISIPLPVQNQSR